MIFIYTFLITSFGFLIKYESLKSYYCYKRVGSFCQNYCEIQSELKQQNDIISLHVVSGVYAVLFNRLCEMHLETESDGEGDFLAAFSSYNPGDHNSFAHLELYRKLL